MFADNVNYEYGTTPKRFKDVTSDDRLFQVLAAATL